jgi:hypothetical protein
MWTFREDVGNVEEVIGMNGVLRLRLATADTLVLIAFQTGYFEEGREAVNLLLTFTLCFIGVLRTSQLFFPRLPFGRSDVDAAHGALAELMNALRGFFAI